LHRLEAQAQQFADGGPVEPLDVEQHKDVAIADGQPANGALELPVQFRAPDRSPEDRLPGIGPPGRPGSGLLRRLRLAAAPSQHGPDRDPPQPVRQFGDLGEGVQGFHDLK